MNQGAVLAVILSLNAASALGGGHSEGRRAFSWWEHPHDIQYVGQERVASTLGLSGVVSDAFSVCHAALLANKRNGVVNLLHIQGFLSPDQDSALWGARRDLLRGLGPGETEAVLIAGSRSGLVERTRELFDGYGHPVSRVIDVDSGRQSWGVAYDAQENRILIQARGKIMPSLEGFRGLKKASMEEEGEAVLARNPFLAQRAKYERMLSGKKEYYESEVAGKPKMERVFGENIRKEMKSMRRVARLLSFYEPIARRFVAGDDTAIRRFLSDLPLLGLLRSSEGVYESLATWSWHGILGLLENEILRSFYRYDLVPSVHLKAKERL